MLNVRTILVQYPEGVRVVFFFLQGETADSKRQTGTPAGCAVGAGAGTAGPCVLVIRLIVAAE